MKILHSSHDTKHPDLRIGIGREDDGRFKLRVATVYESAAGTLRTATAYVGIEDFDALRAEMSLCERMAAENGSAPQPDPADASTGQPEAQKGPSR